MINAQLVVSDTVENDEIFIREEVNYGFGVRTDKYFPPSALQGPFSSLLTHHPQKAVDFIIKLINHAANWYGTKQWSRRVLEPASCISLDIANYGPITQWANCRLYCQYRASQVGPASIISVLMALEAWLLRWGEKDKFKLESWLMYLLKNSNNVMVTGVVSSVCIAYPEKSGRAGLTLLANKDILQLDRQRMVLESGIGNLPFSGLNPSYRVFEEERKSSDALPHRREDLEALAVRLQMTKYRKEVWDIIDCHRRAISHSENEDTRSWRLALHRMDIRGFEPQNVVEGSNEETSDEPIDEIYFGPGKLETDIQKMVDESSKEQANLSLHLSLLNRGRKLWERGPAIEKESIGTTLLEEAIVASNIKEEIEEFCRDGPGLVAAIYLRDHIKDLSDQQFAWCANQINFEVRRTSHATDDIEVLGNILRADRACACVVPLLATTTRTINDFDPVDLLALSLTHPINEVSDYTYAGLGSFVADEHKQVILQCVAASAYRARLCSEMRKKKLGKRTTNRSQEKRFKSTIVLKVRKAIKKMNLDIDRELKSLDFKNRFASVAVKHSMDVFEQHPNWREAREFYCEIVEELVESWCSESEIHHGALSDYQIGTAVVRALANFLLRLPSEVALKVCAPIINVIPVYHREVSLFISELILSADRNTEDCFWDVWQEAAKRIVHSTRGQEWTDDSFNHIDLLNTIFLNNYWDKDVKHWYRLDGHAHRLNELALDLPATVSVMISYCRFLFVIGRKSLPSSFETVAQVLKNGDTIRIASNSDISILLETLLRPFVYSHPHRIKSDASLRESVLTILNALVEGGSSSAYRMRDDFVTPYSIG